jgi:hypothetical protein
VEHLEDDPSVRRNSARALGAIAAADPEAISDHVPKLADYLSAHNIHVIKAIGTALSEATEEAPGDIVEAVAEYLDPEVRYPTRDQAVAAAAAAARVDPSTVEPHLADLIDLARAGRPDRGRYVEALAPLAEAYPARVAPVVPTILTCLREGDDEERAASVETLSSIVVAGEAAQHLDEVATLLTEYLGAEEPSRAGEALDALAAAIEHESEVSDRIAETLEDMEGQKKVRVAQRLVESGARCLDATAQDGLSHSRLRQFID